MALLKTIQVMHKGLSGSPRSLRRKAWSFKRRMSCHPWITDTGAPFWKKTESHANLDQVRLLRDIETSIEVSVDWLRILRTMLSLHCLFCLPQVACNETHRSWSRCLQRLSTTLEDRGLQHCAASCSIVQHRAAPLCLPSGAMRSK